MKTSLSGALYCTSKFCLGILKLSLSLSLSRTIYYFDSHYTVFSQALLLEFFLT